ncbi:hypothetical protein I302_108513 [Kwoniella bestiolae CBS 10118]|uniref:BRCT domain-containing protein n=1 Tax=Kwoniella bestiolae CBS 10118 TaxID=1296100 RepID=A0A1B9FVH7_9TREE|nr:hypothetical protein I302_07113 [Kwoniella bestiolae CBS 10118]OCF22772.1 hypothetical protein I302_07113 [Kwoniella bestiolae CBS 10118]
MRSPPRSGSGSWEDYYSNQRTYIPPSYHGGRRNQFPMPSPISTRGREYSPARRTPVPSYSRREDERHGSRWNLFEELTFYVQAREDESPREVGERVRLMERIKSHGGALSKKPNSTHVTTILISLPTSYPRNTVLLIDTFTSNRLPEVGRWTTRDVMQHLALLSFERASEGQRGVRKRVLRLEWVEECLRSGRVGDERDDFGGWEVKATHDPERVNDINTHRRSLDNAPVVPDSPRTPSLPPSPTARQSPPRVIQLPEDPRKLLRMNAEKPRPEEPAKTPEDLPAEVSSKYQNNGDGDGPRREDTWRPCETISARDQREYDIQVGRSESFQKRHDERNDNAGLNEGLQVGGISCGHCEDDVMGMEDAQPEGEGEGSNHMKAENSAPRDVVTEQSDGQVDDKGDGAETKDTAKGIVVDSDEEVKADIKPVIETKTACSSDGITHSSDNDDNRRQDIQATVRLAPMTDPTVSSTPSPARYTSTADRLHYISRGTSPIPPQPVVKESAQKVFARGVLPLTFCVLGSGREKRFAEILIRDNGGGVLAASTYATIFVLPLSPTDSLYDYPEQLDVVRGVDDQPGRVAVSVDWIEGCVSHNTIIPIEEYRMTPDREMITPPPSGNYASSESGSSGGGKRKGLEGEEQGSQKRSRT